MILRDIAIACVFYRKLFLTLIAGAFASVPAVIIAKAVFHGSY